MLSNGKGFSSLPNPEYRPFDTAKANISYHQSVVKSEYIAGLFKGTLSIIKSPATDQLSSIPDWFMRILPIIKTGN